jgi:hypothetical protein
MTVFRGQLGILQTSEEFGIPAGAAPNLERRRQGLEGRFEFTHRLGDETRLEIAPGFHASTTHAAGSSVPSNVFSLDWFANPWRPVQFSGVFFAGKNIGHFGGLRQGFRVLPDGSLLAVRSRGGWAQLTLLAGSRLSFNIYAGQQDDRNADLAAGAIGKNLSGAANLMFRVAPNVIISLESMQTRTTYLGPGARKLNRYDLAVAYLF